MRTERLPRARVIVKVAAAQLLVLSLWFSATAVLDAIRVTWQLSIGQLPWVTAVLQIGFVVGALAFAATGLADRVGSRRLFTVCALAGAVANGLLVTVTADNVWLAFILRFVTGVALAGVYPTGMKILAGWFVRGRGLALGVLVGSLTVGSALPHLIRGLGLAWVPVILTSSCLAILGSAIVWLTVVDGPHDTTTPSIRLADVRLLLGFKPFRLAVGAYLGHMWELYAAWSWAAVLIADIPSMSSLGVPMGILAFLFIGIGGPSSSLAGRLADRLGSATIASGSMWVSGVAALGLSLFWNGTAVLLALLLLVWGASIISDSAQFSALVANQVPASLRGTALTLQTGLGFALSLISISAAPWFASHLGWRWVPSALVIGPALGVVAIWRLRQNTDRELLIVRGTGPSAPDSLTS